MKNKEVITDINNIPITTTLMVADKFGKRHDNVLRDVKNLDIPRKIHRLNFEEISYTDSYGRKQPYFEMTKDGFMLLVMGFHGKSAMKWKLKFISLFNKMEQKLLQIAAKQQSKWLDARQAGILSRRKETDQIKLFNLYAEKQGCLKYYDSQHYVECTKVVYEKMFIINGPVKDVRKRMTPIQLRNLDVAENALQHQLEVCMEKGMHYDDIYEFLEEKLEGLAEFIGITTINNQILLGE